MTGDHYPTADVRSWDDASVHIECGMLVVKNPAGMTVAKLPASLVAAKLAELREQVGGF